jgi:hypothetical protein
VCLSEGVCVLNLNETLITKWEEGAPHEEGPSIITHK